MTRRKKYAVGLAVLLLGSLWWFVDEYSPEHWLRRVNLGRVTVDARITQADIYFGDPRQSEAETIALVHVPGVGNYFFDFGGETYREVSNKEFFLLPGGAWTPKSMLQGHFLQPLPFRNLNEFRIASTNGHSVNVQF